MTASAATPDRSPADAFTEILGADRVITDEVERRYYSNDIFFWDDAAVAAVVVQPRTKDDVAAIIRTARDLGMAISTRGGGMSYTKGYVPVRADTVLIDLRGLDDILEINTVDNTATVGAGCTWIKLADAVKEEGHVDCFFGTVLRAVFDRGRGVVAERAAGHGRCAGAGSCPRRWDRGADWIRRADQRQQSVLS